MNTSFVLGVHAQIYLINAMDNQKCSETANLNYWCCIIVMPLSQVFIFKKNTDLFFNPFVSVH